MDGKSSTGLQENLAGLLCYAAGWITGLVFFLIEKDSKFVKFHAMQSLITFLVIFGLSIILGILAVIPGIGFIFTMISYVVSLAGLAAWIIGMIFAYQGKNFKFPIVGDIAEGIVNKNP